MKDEIKEILDKLKECANVNEKFYPIEVLKTGKNHLQKISIYNGEAKTLLDFITNLQEENKRLQDRNIELVLERDRLKELCNAYEEEHSTTFEHWKQLIKEDYKSRNEKAIEYIKQHQVRISIAGEKELGFCNEFDIFSNPIILLNILQGEDYNKVERAYLDDEWIGEDKDE